MTVSESLATALEHHQAGRLQEAEQCYRQILSVEPNHAVAYCNLGLVLRSRGKHDEAVACLREALKLKPEIADVNCNLGTVLLDAGKWDEAVGFLRRALDLTPHHAMALIGLGTALERQGNLDEAVVCFRHGLELRPDCAQGHNNLGSALIKLGKLDEAAASYRRALEYEPDRAETHFNLGVVLQDSGLLEEAIDCYRQALELNPVYADAVSNLGTAFHEQGRFEEAADCYRRTLELDPNSTGGHSNWATLALLRGKFEQGWPEYEWRWKTGQLRLHEYPQPKWEGQPLRGKSIVLHSEQGLGDTIQFVRYATAVKALGATVVVECQKALVQMLAKCPGVDRLIGQGDELPPFDFHAPLLSLPCIFKTTLDTIPADVPYLFAERALVEQWRERLSRIEGFRIGINWHGRPGQGDFRKRNIPLEFFVALGKMPGVQLLSLQKDEAGRGSEVGGPRSETRGQRSEVGGQTSESSEAGTARPTIVDVGEFDTDRGAFVDTAAIMMNLDLVITSDTSVAHLAGALGVSVWVVLPFVPDWRWLLDRSDSPWYPTMRLFRQKTIGDWARVFGEIEAALRESVQSSRFNVQS